MRIFFTIAFLAFALFGCMSTQVEKNQNQEKPTINVADDMWLVSPTFETLEKNPITGQEMTHKWVGDKSHLAVEYSQPFVASQDDKRVWLFWSSDELRGKKAKFTATNKNGVTINLIGHTTDFTLRDLKFSDSQASVGTFFSLASPGVWRIDVYVADKLFGSVVVDVK